MTGDRRLGASTRSCPRSRIVCVVPSIDNKCYTRNLAVEVIRMNFSSPYLISMKLNAQLYATLGPGQGESACYQVLYTKSLKWYLFTSWLSSIRRLSMTPSWRLCDTVLLILQHQGNKALHPQHPCSLSRVAAAIPSLATLNAWTAY